MYIGYTQILGECAFLCAFCWLRCLAGIGSHELFLLVMVGFRWLVVVVGGWYLMFFWLLIDWPWAFLDLS
jgi:hypothetical protein